MSLRTILAKGLPANERIVSVTRVKIPKLVMYSAEIRVVIDVHSKTAPKDVLVLLDEVLVGRNRTEITLSTAAPYSSPWSGRAVRDPPGEPARLSRSRYGLS